MRRTAQWTDSDTHFDGGRFTPQQERSLTYQLPSVLRNSVGALGRRVANGGASAGIQSERIPHILAFTPLAAAGAR